VKESMDITARVWETLQQNHPLEPSRRLLLAVSGGADSVFLMHTMQQLVQSKGLSCDLICVHLNHRLRGLDAAKDERFVREQARTRGLAYVSECLPVNDYAARTGLSLETAARCCRLTRLAALARHHRCTTIATGHHRDDNAETVLFRLLRGTGYRGLAGIHPVRKTPDGLCWIRPLLGLSRREIHEHLRAQGLPWREDITNRDISIKRNFIRHRLLPALEETATVPLAESLTGLADGAYRMWQRIEKALVPIWEHPTQCGDATVSVACEILREAPPWLRAAWLQKALAVLDCGQRHINRDHYRTMESLLQGTPGPSVHTLPGGFSLRTDRSRLILSRPPGRSESPTPSPTRITVPGVTHWGHDTLVATLLSSDPQALAIEEAHPSSRVECLDADTIKEPLVIRRRRPGDRFLPLGASGSRKVGKFMTDLKLAKKKRAQVAIIQDQEKIVWVAPLRLSEQVKLTAATQRILKLELLEEAQIVLEE
jgi:tRNA(Ile)-lysidine synthase